MVTEAGVELASLVLREKHRGEKTDNISSYLMKKYKMHTLLRGQEHRAGKLNPSPRKFGTLHEFACHPCAGAMLIFSVSFQF